MLDHQSWFPCVHSSLVQTKASLNFDLPLQDTSLLRPNVTKVYASEFNISFNPSETKLVPFGLK